MRKDEKEQAWNKVKESFEQGATLTIVPGPSNTKQKTKKQRQIEMITELVKIAFLAGLESGHARGRIDQSIDEATEEESEKG